MDIIDQVKKLEAFHIAIFILGFVGIVSPGLLVLFLFKRDLFLSLDFLKLMFLSISLSLPIILCNFFLMGPISDNSESKTEVGEALAMALLVSSAVYYLPLVVMYLWGFSLHTFVWTLVGLEVVLVVGSVTVSLLPSSKKKK